MTEHRGRLLALAALPVLLAAGAATPDPSTALAGRYYRQFPNALVTGEKYTGEDIVEIVPVARNAAYVRVELSYYNGHSCSNWGVARAERDTLVYRQPRSEYDDTQCILTLRRAGKSLLIDDGGGTCSSSCGARGTLTAVKLPWASKRPIRYMARLKASPEYRSALNEWRTGKAQP